MLPRFLDLFGDELFIGQNGSVFGGEYFVRQSIQRVTRDRFIFLAAKNETDRRIFVAACPMFARVVEIHVHLAGVGVGEPATLEIDDDEASELAMKEQQIDAIPFVADAEAALPADESEIAAELHEKPFDMPDERFFDVGLGVFVLEAEKFEDVWIFDFFLRRDRIFGFCLRALGEHFRFVSRRRRALVEERIDLAIELAHAPAAAERFGLVELSRCSFLTESNRT